MQTYKSHGSPKWCKDTNPYVQKSAMYQPIGTHSQYVSQCVYHETNVMHFSFNLLRIKCLYMFRWILTHPREAHHKQHLVYCVRMSVSCGKVPLLILRRRFTNDIWYIACVYARNIPYAVCVTPPADEQVFLETYRGPWFSINSMKSASRWLDCTDILWCTVSTTLTL
jgi:hypothetical protein